jgi:hypothetical protein
VPDRAFPKTGLFSIADPNAEVCCVARDRAAPRQQLVLRADTHWTHPQLMEAYPGTTGAGTAHANAIAAAAAALASVASSPSHHPLMLLLLLPLHHTNHPGLLQGW